VRLAHAFALESDYIKSDMVEISEFPYLANKYAIRGVPKIVINEDIHIEGAIPEQRFVDEILKSLEPRQWTH
jgi:predicted DsbA family dithiol-disulfide isomerase